MAKPRIEVGTFGTITFTVRSARSVEARTRYRDWDGKKRLVQATGPSEMAAERALKKKLSVRMQNRPVDTMLTPDSLFGDLVTYWLADLDLENRLAPSTRVGYEQSMYALAMPAFEHLTLREIGVARCDMLLKQLGQLSYSRAKRARVVLRLAFGVAVRHEVLPRNPLDSVSRLNRPASTPTALTPAQADAIRAAIVYWQRGLSASGPKPDGKLGQIVEVMLGTSARIGEGVCCTIW